MVTSLEGIAATLAVVVAVGTYMLTSQREKSIRRAELVRAYTADFYSAKALVDLFVEIDYSRFEFHEDETSWLSRGPEVTLVHMLDLFNSLGHNVERKALLVEDLHGTTLGYAIMRAHACPGVRAYLEYIQKWDANHLGTGVPFQFFQTVAIKLEKRSTKARKKNSESPAVMGELAPDGPQSDGLDSDVVKETT